MPEVEADALLAPVVHREVDALPADHGRMLARLLAARRLDLDHLGAQVGEQHAAARARLEARQFEDADAVEATRHGGRLGGQDADVKRRLEEKDTRVLSRGYQPRACATEEGQ